MAGLRMFLPGRIRLAFTNRFYQARIIRTEHFDDRVALTQRAHAVRDGKSPGLLIPGELQGWITVPIIWNVDFSFHTRYRLHQLPDAVHAFVPLAIQLLLIKSQPSLQGGKATDHLFLPNLHGTAHRSLARTGVHESRLDQILPAQ